MTKLQIQTEFLVALKSALIKSQRANNPKIGEYLSREIDKLEKIINPEWLIEKAKGLRAAYEGRHSCNVVPNTYWIKAAREQCRVEYRLLRSCLAAPYINNPSGILKKMEHLQSVLVFDEEPIDPEFEG